MDDAGSKREVLVEAHVSPELQERAARVLGDIGLTVSDALRLLLLRTAEEGTLPFDLRPDADHDAWFRAKVQEALDDPRSDVSDREAGRRIARLKAQLKRKHA